MFQAKGFYSDLKDYIYQENNLAGYKSYTNIDAHIYGGDIKAGVDLIHGFSLDGGLAYQRGRKDSFPDNNTNKDLGQIAPLKSKLALNYNNDEPCDQRHRENLSGRFYSRSLMRANCWRLKLKNIE